MSLADGRIWGRHAGQARTFSHVDRRSTALEQLCCATRPFGQMSGDLPSLRHCSMSLHLQLQSLLCAAVTPP